MSTIPNSTGDPELWSTLTHSTAASDRRELAAALGEAGYQMVMLNSTGKPIFSLDLASTDIRRQLERYPENSIGVKRPGNKYAMKVKLDGSELKTFVDQPPILPADYFTLVDERNLDFLPPLTWLVDDLIRPRTLNEVYGTWGSYKTFFMLDLALSVASGEPFHGREVVEPGKVAYVFSEYSADVATRIAAWKTEHDLDEVPDFTPIFQPVKLWDATQKRGTNITNSVMRLSAQLEERGRFKVIVVDTLARSLSGREEAEHMGAAVENCNYLQSELGTAVVLVHHTGKDERRGGRGHSSLDGALDTTIRLKAKGDQLSVICEKQKMAADFETFTLQAFEQSGSLVLRDAVDPLDGEILRHLAGGWTTTGDLDAAIVDTSRKTILRRLTELHKEGQIERKGEQATGYEWRLQDPE